MAGNVEEVYLKVHEADKAQLLELEKEYVEKKDWYSAMIVAAALIHEASNRDEFFEFGSRHEKYLNYYFNERKKEL